MFLLLPGNKIKLSYWLIYKTEATLTWSVQDTEMQKWMAVKNCAYIRKLLTEFTHLILYFRYYIWNISLGSSYIFISATTSGVKHRHHLNNTETIICLTWNQDSCISVKLGCLWFLSQEKLFTETSWNQDSCISVKLGCLWFLSQEKLFTETS